MMVAEKINIFSMLVNRMTNKYAYVACDNCNFVKNWVSVEEVSKGTRRRPVPILCQRCGVGTSPVMPIEVSDDYLRCLPLKGVAARIPLGAPTANGVVAGDGSGPYPVDEYIRRFVVDPWKNWCFRHPESKACEERKWKYIPMPEGSPHQPPEQPPEGQGHSTEDFGLKALDKLKKDNIISEDIYKIKYIAIIRLKNLKDKDLIDEADYSDDVKKILGNDPKVILGI